MVDTSDCYWVGSFCALYPQRLPNNVEASEKFLIFLEIFIKFEIPEPWIYLPLLAELAILIPLDGKAELAYYNSKGYV